MRVLFIIKDFVIESLGILYLSAVLKKNGHQTDIVKADAEDVDEKMKSFGPDIVAYSIMTGSHQYFRELNAGLKRRFSFVSIFGGPHATFFSEFINEDGVDIICIGEGEGAIADLADKIRTGEDFTRIPNLWVKYEGQIIKNPVRPFADVNALPFADRALIYDKYQKSYNNPIKGFMGTRGCPYDCSFCFNHLLKEIYQGTDHQYMRFRAVDNLIEEIVSVKTRYPLKMVFFQDDTFGMRADWLEEFAEKYKKSVGLPFHCNERVDVVTERTVESLKKAGCTGVSIAIETANDYLRNEILKKRTTRDQILGACKLIKRAGLRLRIYNMVGLPHGSLKDDFETLKLNILCGPDLAVSAIYQPHPRTKLGDEVIKMGLYSGDHDRIHEKSYFGESPLNIKDKTKINNLQKLFMLTVSFPFLLPLTKLLICLPPNALFVKIYNAWKKILHKKVYGYR